ncbi:MULTISPECIES: 3-oxoacyl-ACP reductase family protein [Pectobacterium]|uniref:3-oxoacyl-ACP reductase family protein n=1 Tax=Pectobacterium parvum TaxID=2778550 RepID=A0AAP9IEV1_9GAMM|nr:MULTISPECIES: 3-oxoacyl-ACP reductase family protein [Pectobacterium]KFX18159.1 oxidoreductase [Pectobacterium parvum]QHQ23555.1 SDR family oxidoreductase [Pectobacterium parvum]UVD97262.1 3-oxoacyl-ACP reductase FabG [Pectobacterium parvum]
MTELTDKKALVTGASRGIGAAIALELAEKGADVAITYQNSEARALEVVRAIEAKGRRAFAIKADSADAEAVVRSVNEAADALGGLDILVNNAGIARGGMLSQLSLADIDDTLNVNVRAVLLASQAAIPHLGQGGRIISIGSSVAERVPMPGMSVYAMSKSALLSFTRGLARELGPNGITVNLVHPGSTDTDMNPADGEHSEAQRSSIALGHYGKPEDIAAAVAFLASPAARQITGTGITVDGGSNA